jgi:alpha-tubulin suppressor-like RCC1 family protein
MSNFFVPGEGEITSLYLTKEELTHKVVGNHLWVWGRNEVGRLGTNDITDRSLPVMPFGRGINWKQVAIGHHSIAIKTDGSLWAWGHNTYGQIGDNTTTHRSVPTQAIGGSAEWKQVSAGGYHSVGIKTNNSLWAWGHNTYGQIGDNTTTHKSIPTQTFCAGNDWRYVACGFYHTAAIKYDGTLWSWGQNTFGQLGDNSTAHRVSPVQTIGGNSWKQISCGHSHSAGIKTNGSLWLWGQNDYGQLGDNTTTNKSSPVQTVAGGTNWKEVSCGNRFTLAIKTDGTLWAWGHNIYGQIGDNTTTHRSSPVQTVAGGTNWKQLGLIMGLSSYAIKTDGTLWSWGYNGFGQLGIGNTTHRSSPVQISSKSINWKQVSGGSDHAAAIPYVDP